MNIIEFLNMLGDVTAYINTTFIAPSIDCFRNMAVEMLGSGGAGHCVLIWEADIIPNLYVNI